MVLESSTVRMHGGIGVSCSEKVHVAGFEGASLHGPELHPGGLDLAEVCAELHKRRVLSVMPEMYDDLCTAGKGMYKMEPAVADGGDIETTTGAASVSVALLPAASLIVPPLSVSAPVDA